jgi:hypothetical protein
VYARGYDIPEPALKRMYDADREQVRYERQDAKLREDSISMLHRKRKHAEHAIADGLKLHASQKARNQVPFWRARHAAILRELDRCNQEPTTPASSHAEQRSMPLMDCAGPDAQTEEAQQEPLPSHADANADAAQVAGERPDTHPDHTRPDLWRSQCNHHGVRLVCISDPSWVTPWRQRGGVPAAQRDLAAGRVERREEP